MLELGVKVLLAYLLGSVNGSLLVGRFYGGVDIRAEGSGNPGGTNALRTHGKVFALWVVVIDVGKGFLAAAWLPGLGLGMGFDPAVGRDWLAVSCAGAAVVGHVFPVWFGFRGGKGAATLVGSMLALAPTLLLPLIAMWVLVLVVSGYVGLATICGAVTAPAYLWATDSGSFALGTFTVLMAVLIIYAHRGNIQRIRAGTEYRATSAMLFRR